MTEKIDKYKVQAALVRSFFDAFSHGVIDSQVEDPKEKTTPQSVKKLMLEHYEHIAPAFFDTMFFPLAAMNYKYEDIAALAREACAHGVWQRGVLQRYGGGIQAQLLDAACRQIPLQRRPS